LLQFSEIWPRKRKKEEPIPKKVEEIKHVGARTIPESDHVETSKGSERTMLSAKPLREFEQIDWVLIDFGEILTREDRSLIKRGWQKLWRWTFHKRNKWNINTT
jgi:hypothetical protein